VVVDDGSTSSEALAYLKLLEPCFAERQWQLLRQENRYPGAARNKAARHARGEYVLFMDDDNIAMPIEVATLVRVAERTGADVLTAVINVFHGSEPPGDRPLKHWLPLGSAVAAGVLNNCFGDMNALVRRDAFLALGGMTEDYGLSHEDWELFAKATLHGYKQEVVPEPLFWYRVTEGSITHSTVQAANYLRHLRPYLETVPDDLRELLIYCHGMKFRTDMLSKEHGNMFTYAANLERHFKQVKSWSDHVEGEFQRLVKEHDELVKYSAQLQAWSERLQQDYQKEYHKLEQAHDELCRRFRWRRYELADRVVRWIKKLPLAFPALHKVAQRMVTRSSGVG
jgi:GT2 family glycosyltransferase